MTGTDTVVKRAVRKAGHDDPAQQHGKLCCSPETPSRERSEAEHRHHARRDRRLQP